MVSETKRLPLELPARPVAGAVDLLSAMFHHHYDFVWRSVRRLGVLPEAVDDATQEVFVVASRKLALIDVGKEKAFLFGAAIRVASDSRRAHSRRGQAPSGDPPEPIDGTAAQGELVDQKRAREILDEIVSQLNVLAARLNVLAAPQATSEQLGGAETALGRSPTGVASARSPGLDPQPSCSLRPGTINCLGSRFDSSVPSHQLDVWIVLNLPFVCKPFSRRSQCATRC